MLATLFLGADGLGAAVELTADDLRELEIVVSQITAQGLGIPNG